jgi:hypothetical protein
LTKPTAISRIDILDRRNDVCVRGRGGGEILEVNRRTWKVHVSFVVDVFKTQLPSFLGNHRLTTGRGILRPRRYRNFVASIGFNIFQDCYLRN